MVLNREEGEVWLRQPVSRSLDRTPLLSEELRRAQAKLDRFRPVLARFFSETGWDGRIRSPLLEYPRSGRPRLLVKADNDLPMTGSIKARGGVYEVLCRIDDILAQKGHADLPLVRWAKRDFSQLLFDDLIAVASTGNLGFSVGVISCAFGLRATVHMSRDAKEWKKQRLRLIGVEVVEHECDYSETVAIARETAKRSGAYFIDDESSRRLFVGYAVAAKELADQLKAEGIVVDRNRPLVVYLPCGVGGAPGGIAAGLRLEFGEDVTCVLVEPQASACMFMAMQNGGLPVSVYDGGRDNRSIADGLAVPVASRLVLDSAGHQIDAVVTLSDDQMIGWVGRAWREASLRLEPSAAAALAAIEPFRRAVSDPRYQRATHVAWATGGSMLPDAEFQFLLKNSAG